MKTWKNWVATLVLATIIVSSPSNIQARECCTDAGGYAYEDVANSCCLIPAVVFAVVAIAGIIAVGVQNRSHSGHGHAHSD
jgi:hypothetical protein